MKRQAAFGFVLALVAGFAGCTSPAPEEETIEPASIEGSIVVGDAFNLIEARLSVAPEKAAAEGTSRRPVVLADPPWVARTPLARDHWVLEATIVERAPATGAGTHRVRLDWNGEPAGSIYVLGRNASSPLAVTLRFDVGAEIPRSNLYAFEITRTP